MESNFVETNHIKLHYLDSGGENPPLLLTHGLTANAHAFDGLVKAGLTDFTRLISVDLRGRGLSDQPIDGYSMKEHAADVLGLMDALGIKKCNLGGHSFGALLSIYMAVHHPERIQKLVILDAAAKLHEKTKEMLGPALGRLGQVYESEKFYIDKVKSAPYLSFWDEQMASYYQADIRTLPDGTVTPIPTPENMTAAIMQGSFGEPWLELIPKITHPSILINGADDYALGAPLLPKEYATETVEVMQDCIYVQVPGNHQTMLYRNGAKAMVEAIKSFL